MRTEDRSAQRQSTKGKAKSKSRARRSKPGILWRIWSFLWKLALIVVVLCGAAAIYLDQQIAQKFEGQKWHLPAQIYSRSMALYPGAAVSHHQLLAELRLLGYRKVANPREVGEFSASATKVDLWRRPFLHPLGSQEATRVLISFDEQGVSSVSRGSDKRELAVFHLEPMLLDRIIAGDGEDRLFVPRKELPQHLVDALLLVEDRAFYEHHGVNPFAIIRAAFINISAGRTVQGGSTLTQQLAKNFFLTSERSLERKIREALMAIIIDFRYSKDEILEAYLNEVYMGQDKARGVHGMGLASQFYFGRPLTELTVAQQAFLVAVIKGPSYYNPWRYPDRAQERRDLVLRLLMESGKISVDEFKIAAESPLGLRPENRPVHQKIPAFYAQVKKELALRWGDSLLNESGIKVYTTLDPIAQEAAEKAVKDVMGRIGKDSKELQASMVVTDKYGGGIAALVSDRNPGFDGYNRVTEMRRPIGSLVKPFVYMTALEDPKYNLMTSLKDEPLTITNKHGQSWSPLNYDKTFSGRQPLMRAMFKSLNIPTVNLGMAVGVENVVQTMRDAGWREETINPYPSMLLGAVDGSPMMVAQVYQTLADNGRFRQLYTVTDVLDMNNEAILTSRLPSEQAIDPVGAYLAQYAMTRVVAEGTGARLGRTFPGITLAGKTGTSNDSRDSWFAGFDERNVAAVWVGRDDNGKTKLVGASGAMAIYQAFLEQRPPVGLRMTPPDGVIQGYFNSQGSPLERNCAGAIPVPARAGSWNPEPNCGQPLSWWQQLLGN
ncbi:penicillin-binding protein 1B [Shewanella sp. JM162201]|uniref:Penicillin-binding protein 1B n=1 Tax=Shewanella jiangmenensis TaxID=2837387 RepID=A0ABS5V1X2_9GAMM|nr:penicillin-binding protein 1B [Shewanella jiangmenensis]MBT1443786.1 penicillin-binding protein 1B [Shewanella jiangmenensis]